MTVIAAACPAGLRGHMTRWLLEISPGVFVCTITSRVRKLLWRHVIDMVKNGRAIMVFQTDNEQGTDFLVHNHHWQPTDYDSIHLMLRPANTDTGAATKDGPTQNWSTASRLRRYKRR